MTTKWPAAPVRPSSARLVARAAVMFLFAAGIFTAIAWRGRIDVPPPVATQFAEVTAESLARAEHANAEARDPRADAYRRLGEYLAARYRVSAVVATDIFGGIAQALDSVEIYNPATGQFSPFGILTVARQNHTATLLNDGRILIAGGVGRPSVSGTAEVLQP